MFPGGKKLLDQVPTFVFLLGCIVLLILHIGNVFAKVHDPGIWEEKRRGFVDFHNAIFFPGKFLLEGGNPYGTEYVSQQPDQRGYPLFPPHSLLMHLPFALASIEVSRHLYVIFQLIMLITLIGLIVNTLEMANPTRGYWMIGLLVLSTIPFYMHFHLGQLTLQIAVGAIAAIRYAKARPILSGMALAIAAFKPQFGVPIALLMLARGDWKPVLLGGSFATLISFGVIGWIAMQVGPDKFIADLRQNYFSLDQHPEVGSALENHRRIDLYPVAERLNRGPLPSWTKIATTLSMLAIATIAIFRRLRLPNPAPRATRNWETTLILLTTIACVYHSFYDAIVLVWPALLLIGDSNIHKRWPKFLVVGLIIFVCYNGFSLNFFLERVGRDGSAAWLVAASTSSLAVIAAWSIALWQCLFTNGPGSQAKPTVSTNSSHGRRPHLNRSSSL